MKKSVELSEKQNSEIVAKMSSKEKDALIARLTEKLENNKLGGIQQNFVMYKFQMLVPKLNADEQKKKRNAIRTKLFNFCDSISLYFIMSVRAKNANDKLAHTEKMNKECREFIQFYKQTYILNDFSLASLFSGNDEKKKRVSDMLDILKTEFLSKEETKQKKEQTKIVPAKTVDTKEEIK